MPDYSTQSVTTNVNGFQKTTYPERQLIVYRGNNYSISVREGNFIEWLDSDETKLYAQDTQRERFLRVLDYENLTDKRGTSTAEEYAEDIIIGGDSETQTITTTGGGGGGGDVTVIANNTDFSTEATLTALLNKILASPSTEAQQITTNNLLSGWNNEGVPLRSQQGVSFGVSSKEDDILSGISTGDDECAYLFRAKAGSGGVSLRSFFLSFESTTNDEYEIRFSVNPTFSNHTFVDGNFSTDPIVAPINPVQSKLEVAIAGELGVPVNPLISGYDQANGGRFLLGKRALGRETVDSRLLFELFIPEGATFAVSILATDNGASVKASANWNE